MSGIPLSWLISVNSVGVRDTFSLSKLPTLLITKAKDDFLNEKWTKHYNAESVLKNFGYQSTTSTFAKNYFGVTNKNASKPDLLNILNWNEKATASALIGAKCADIEALKKINGAFSIEMQGVKRNVSLNLSSVLSYSNIAEKLQEAIRKAGEIQQTTLTIQTTASNGTANQVTFTINTNAGDYTAEVADPTKATFTKETRILRGVAQGSTTITFKAKNGLAQEIRKVYNVVVSGSPFNITLSEQPQESTPTNENLPAFKNASVIFDSNTQGFRITSGITGADSKISYTESPTEGSDISQTLGLSKKEGAKIYQGLDSVAGLDNLLSEISENNGAYFNIALDFYPTSDELKTLGNWAHNSNNRYIVTACINNREVLEKEDITKDYKGYNGLILDYMPTLEANGFSSGLISALDFSQINGNTNLAFNNATQFDSIAVSTERELNNLEANLCNSILRFSQIGQSTTWYGMGNIMGTLTNNANVYICNAYLTLQLQLQFANMFGAQGMIGLRGANNEGIIRGYADSVLSGCVKNGVIVQGATLTTTESQKLISAFGSSGESAIKQCENVGYFYVLDKPDLSTSTQSITLAYVANKAVKKLVITNYVLGA